MKQGDGSLASFNKWNVGSKRTVPLLPYKKAFYKKKTLAQQARFVILLISQAFKLVGFSTFSIMIY
jgi:hypothetical protein